MTAFRTWLAELIFPCGCREWFDEGAVFIWRNVDASACPKRRHQSGHVVVGSRAT